jgi:hypothetical protein
MLLGGNAEPREYCFIAVIATGAAQRDCRNQRQMRLSANFHRQINAAAAWLRTVDRELFSANPRPACLSPEIAGRAALNPVTRL